MPEFTVEVTPEGAVWLHREAEKVYVGGADHYKSPGIRASFLTVSVASLAALLAEECPEYRYGNSPCNCEEMKHNAEFGWVCPEHGTTVLPRF